MQSIIKKKSIQYTDRPVSAAPGKAPRRASGSHVELLQDDGTVQGVQVTCECGRATVVEFEYADATPDGATQEQEELGADDPA